MGNFYYALLASGVVSLIAFVGVVTFAFKDRVLEKILFGLVGFAAGGLMGGAFFHLLPEALEVVMHGDSGYGIVDIFVFVVVGFALFFVLERLIHWRHCHHNGECKVHSFAYMNLVGDSVHNFIDGVVIAAAFMVDVRLGVITTLSIVLHEIPQEIGDFGVLVYAGISKVRALFYNFLTALTAVAGVVVGWFIVGEVAGFSAVLLPFAAGGFIYIAASDLVPELHKEEKLGKALLAFMFFVIGLIFMWGLAQIGGHAH
jgi:zinc and cadmium transporter